MADEPSSPVASPLVSALSSSVSSPRTAIVAVTDKGIGLLEESVPMVIVQQFIEENKEKGMPGNQKMNDLKKKREEIKAERKKVVMELRNEERKRSRLKSRAKKLSAEDLCQVLALRATASNNKKIKMENANKAAGSAVPPASE